MDPDLYEEPLGESPALAPLTFEGGYPYRVWNEQQGPLDLDL